MHRVERLSIREIHRRTGLHRDTIRRALADDKPPPSQRPPSSSKLDPFRPWIEERLRAGPRGPVAAARAGGGARLSGRQDDFRRLRARDAPSYLVRRPYQRTIYRPGQLLQFDLFEPREPIPVGHGQLQRGWVVTAELATRERWPLRWCSQSRRPICSKGWRVPRAAGRAARDAGLGPRGGDPRRWCPPQPRVRRLLGPAGGELDHPRPRRRLGHGLAERSHR
jgi:hypothetical protein